jgi:hypothetical protein
MKDFTKILFIICGLYSFAIWLVIIVRSLILGIKSKSWPTVEGEVIFSEVKPAENRGGVIKRYSLAFQYEYDVAGKTYRSSSVSFADSTVLTFNNGTRSKRAAQSFVTAYQVGQTVVVSYNPQNPKQAVLMPTLLNINFIILMLIFGAFGLLLLYIIEEALRVALS